MLRLYLSKKKLVNHSLAKTLSDTFDLNDTFTCTHFHGRASDDK